MKKRPVFQLVLGLVLCGMAQAAVYTFDSASTDFFNEANWDDGSGGNPPANTINPGTSINADLVIDSDTVSNSSGRIDVGSGYSLTMTGGALSGTSGFYAGVVAMSGTSTVTEAFINGTQVSLRDSAGLTLTGAAAAINTTAGTPEVDFLSDEAQLHFTAKDVASVEGYLSRFTVNGEAAVQGVNLSITSDGGAGAIVQAIAVSDDVYTSNVSPDDLAEKVDPTAPLSWTVVNATSPTFDINIGTTSACNDVLVAQSTGSSMSYTPPAGRLDYATTYYWRPDVTDGGTEYPGTVWSFTTGGKATDPVPSDGQTGVELAGLVSWTGDATIASYDVYFAESGGSFEFVKNTLTPTVSKEDLAAAVGLDLLASNTTYQWRVDTRDSGGVLLATGETWTFTMETYTLTCQDKIQLGLKEPGDMDNNCEVNILDLVILAQQWLL